MARETLEEQSLRLLRAFNNIDDPDAREVVITIARFAESRSRRRTQNDQRFDGQSHTRAP